MCILPELRSTTARRFLDGNILKLRPITVGFSSQILKNDISQWRGPFFEIPANLSFQIWRERL